MKDALDIGMDDNLAAVCKVERRWTSEIARNSICRTT
jgi:hypothetical protein